MECIHGARVSAREQISPLMVRVTLELEEPRTWVSTGVGDEFIHVDVGAETLDADGHSERHYTVSGLVEGGLELEVFLHGDGPGATWGRGCAIGDRVSISDPMDYYGPPAGSGLRVLVGDLTALPGIVRILADAGAEERFRVVVELPDMAETRELVSAAHVDVDWLIGGNGIGPSAVCEALRGLDRDGVLTEDCYVWVACESKESRRARALLRKEVGLPISQQRIVGYWHANLEQVMEKWNALSDEVKGEYLAIWRDDRTDEENWTELEPFLQAHGA
jgi:NADPH-dependent ferric siderophore reductase